MNNAIDELKRIYKPYRLTKKNNITILDSTSGSFVIKMKENDHVSDAYQYLMSRNFDYFPKLIPIDARSDVNVFEYLEDIPMPKEQKAEDLMELVALLHNKTTYYKEVTEDCYKEIYENIKDNILYSKNYYDMMYHRLVEEIYPSPSHYLVLRNLYKIFASLEFGSNELDDWYEKVKNSTKTRVAFIHNNLETDHFIENHQKYLISWERSRIDSPILDLITFYQKEYMNYNFETLFKKYMSHYELSKEEKQLLFIVLSIPPKIEFSGTEMKDVESIRKKLDYIFKTEHLTLVLMPNGEDK